MGKFQAHEDIAGISPGRKVPHWPHACQVTGCNDETAVALLFVKNNRGKLECGAASQYLTERRSDDNWTLRDGYVFIGWLTRCGYHRSEDSRRHEQQLRTRLEHDES